MGWVLVFVVLIVKSQFFDCEIWVLIDKLIIVFQFSYTSEFDVMSICMHHFMLAELPVGILGISWIFIDLLRYIDLLKLLVSLFVLLPFCICVFLLVAKGASG